MTYLFLIPLLGLLLNLIFKKADKTLLALAITTLTVYSALMGVMEIAGTSSNLCLPLLIIGLLMMLTGIIKKG